MFDVTARMTYRNVPTWYRDLLRATSDYIPIVLVGNKCDVEDRRVKAKQITFHRRRNLQYFDISVKSGYNFLEPFVYIMRKLTGDRDLHIIPEVAVIPSKDVLIKDFHSEEELKRAHATELEQETTGFQKCHSYFFDYVTTYLRETCEGLQNIQESEVYNRLCSASRINEFQIPELRSVIDYLNDVYDANLNPCNLKFMLSYSILEFIHRHVFEVSSTTHQFLNNVRRDTNSSSDNTQFIFDPVPFCHRTLRSLKCS
ncbi:hypothetical protein GEMRC1_014180 [Eukaryota sp. GEM-RC1]